MFQLVRNPELMIFLKITSLSLSLVDQNKNLLNLISSQVFMFILDSLINSCTISVVLPVVFVFFLLINICSFYFKFTWIGIISRIWAPVSWDQDSWLRWYFRQWIWSDFCELNTFWGRRKKKCLIKITIILRNEIVTLTLHMWHGISCRSWCVTEMWKARSFRVKYFFGQVGTGHLKFLIFAWAWKCEMRHVECDN